MRLILACLLFSRGALDAQCVRGSRAQLDRTRPVPAKADVLDAWQRRQSAIHSFYFAWTELQTQPRGWIANPRYVERERLAAPSLEDRRYAVNKTLAVSRDSMRYSYTLDRRAEGETTGNSDRRHYSYAYESVFDGRRNVARATSLTDTPETTIRSNDNADAQNLDTRAILTALRPLDPILGDLLIDRAVRLYRRHLLVLIRIAAPPVFMSALGSVMWAIAWRGLFATPSGAQLALYLCHMSGYDEMNDVLDLITSNAAKTLRIQDSYGIDEEKSADFLSRPHAL